MAGLPRVARVAILTTTGLFVVVGIAESVWLWRYVDGQHALGLDLAYFRSIAERWLDTGEFYLPRQLAGPYIVESNVDVLYPPNALFLFVPFLFLPWPLWWAVPIGVFTWSLWQLRPAPWTWPLMAAGIAYPPTISPLLYGNTNMWIAAALAAGVVWGWPSVFVLLKPSLAPFALVGVRTRGWWIALAVLILASASFGALWADYVVAIRNSSLGPAHALVTVPLLLVPIVAWFGRTRRRSASSLGWRWPGRSSAPATRSPAPSDAAPEAPHAPPGDPTA